GRVQTSPNSTSSVKCTRAGAKSPNILAAPEGPLDPPGLVCCVIVVVLSVGGHGDGPGAAGPAGRGAGQSAHGTYAPRRHAGAGGRALPGHDRTPLARRPVAPGPVSD